jgi:RNA polymerase sigma-70 factor (ECF subfamily)
MRDTKADPWADMADADVLRCYAQGDGQAADILTERLTPRVFGQAFRLLGHRAEAEDVTQDALMRLWRIAPEWRHGEAQVTTWLYRVVFNLATDRLRKRAKVHVPLDKAPDLADETSKSAADQMQDKARSDALQKALMTLPDRQRQAVVLRHIEGLTNPEIAEIMEIGVEAVESLTARGKRALTAALIGEKTALGYEET